MASARDELLALLRTLNLSAMGEAVEATALRAAKEGLTHEAFLLELVRIEQAAKVGRRIERLRKQAELAPGKTFRALDLNCFDPATRMQMERLQAAHSSKTQSMSWPSAARALARAISPAPWDTPWSNLVARYCSLRPQTAALVQRLLAAKRDLRLPQELAKLDRCECLILDDIAYVQHDRDEMEVLFTLLAERYERRSVVITTNLVFSEWERIFKDPMTTMAAIDRVVHHRVVLDLMDVESYRANVAATKQAGSDKTAEPA
ncbi:ATP-binding protein [Pandoraea faecigallinarum]|uniref:ATP-binding protein n=1 Tax=Pandoraea faecigallinarum TaxID=656179 RepID=UPI000A876D7B|nr:ATP-binding protein [Pandoraea faecigallinarum]